MNDIISYASNVELYVDHDINIPEIVEGPLVLTGDVSKDEGDNSGSDVSVHGDEGNLGSEKSSDVDSGSDDVSVIDWETSSDDSAWSLGSDKTNDEQVNIAKLAQEVRKGRRNATRITTDQATIQEATVTDAAGIEETTTCSKGRKRKSVAQHKVRRGDEEDRESDYTDSDNPGAWEFHWNSDEEDDIFVEPDHVVSRNVCQTYYNPKWKVPYFDIGMRFKDAKQFRMTVCKYSIQKQAQLRKVRNERTRVRFRCQTGCKWELFASYDSRYECFVVKTYYGEHRCFKSYDNELVTYKVVADLFKGRIYEAPFTKPTKIVKWCKTEIKVNITLDKAEKAEKHVMTQLEGSYVDEYKYLKSYAKILSDSHPENTVVVTAIETSSSDARTFHRMYVCLHSLKQGWKDGCRRLFGVDGYFLKGICKGILLFAVGKDGNNQMFPIAWVVVESECLKSWQWFFELLKTNLDLGTGAGVTVMSDEHQAEHRHCARHIYCNWAKLGHRGDEMKICFWNCAKATFQDDFIDKLESQGCGVQPNGVNEFEVNDGGDQHVVKFDEKTCTCRYWQLSGVPCPHALACIRYKRWRVKHYISDFYKKEKYLAAYAYPLQCIRKGTKAWKAVGEEELLPPPVRSMPGRPRRKRRRHKGEPQRMKKRKLRKLTGKGRKMTCKVCGNEGHNRRTCPYNNEEGVNKRKKQGGEGASTSGSKRKRARVPTATGSFIGVDDAAASSVLARPTTTEGNEKA
ncbi:hypothetical protein SLEP1_g3316 [Rubroshorea leprosula]|uniref:SWIM-type domain-containing protein n=1 Tax=Rubroshorea leprosula TaxID=152421 RepID=A0AAV5HT84_9ROSI|nr:hypothetical protein SLEP1_g3316 [Rubroshorea leprosula]